MTALVNQQAIRNPSPRGLVIRQARPSTTFFGGWLVGHRIGSKLCEIPDPLNPRKDLLIEGVLEYIESPPFVSSATTDSGGGAIDPILLTPQNMRIVTAPTGPFDTAASGANKVTEDMIGLSGYAADNNTIYATDNNGTLPRAGTIDRVESGKVYLVFDNDAGAVSADNAVNFAVRNVITALPAYTASAGTITVTATGALGTQDGVTLAAGDEVWLPEYAGTANSSVNVSNANSGPYEVINPGATGVQPVLRRPRWWPHGGAMPLGASVKVAEGTLFGRTVWDVGAPAGSVIGTTDPAAYPREVVQQVTLVSSTVTVTNVPIRAGHHAVTANLATAGGTLTSTVGYGPIVDPTPGPIGTASLVIDAIASGMTKNGTADTSTLNLSIRSQ